MTKIFNDERLGLSLIRRTRIPKLNKKFEKEVLNTWAYNHEDLGREILEKLITLLGDYTFDPHYVKTGENTIELRTVDGRLIKIELLYGDMDEMPEILITDGNITSTYTALYIKDEKLMYLDTEKEYNADTKATKFFKKYYDRITIDKGETIFSFEFYNPEKTSCYYKEPKFQVDSRFKDQLIALETDNIVDYYNFIIDHLSTDIQSFMIVESEHKNYNIVNKIEVKGGRLVFIKLTKKVNKGTISIQENLDNKEYLIHAKDCELLDPEDDYNEFKQTQDVLSKKLKRETK